MPALAMTRPSRCRTMRSPRCARSTSVDFGEDQLDEACVLARDGGELARARAGDDIGEPHVAAFRLGHDLLRDDEHVACEESESGTRERLLEERGEVAPGKHLGNVAQRRERQRRRGGAHSSGGSASAPVMRMPAPSTW